MGILRGSKSLQNLNLTMVEYLTIQPLRNSIFSSLRPFINYHDCNFRITIGRPDPNLYSIWLNRAMRLVVEYPNNPIEDIMEIAHQEAEAETQANLEAKRASNQ